jgi:hypothetical protein
LKEAISVKKIVMAVSALVALVLSCGAYIVWV